MNEQGHDKDYKLLEQEIKYVKEANEKAIEHLREIYNKDKEALEKALELQAAEYERRMQTLNHEAARILNVQTISVSQEIFDAFKTTINDQIIVLQKWQAAEKGKKEIYGMILMIVMFLLTYFKSQIITTNQAQIEVLEQKVKVLEEAKPKK